VRPEGIRAIVRDVTGAEPRDLAGAGQLEEGARVVAAMSGGVDSAVAAAILRGAGLDVVGVSMRLGSSSRRAEGHAGCCSLDDFEDARRTAVRLDVPHYVVDLRDLFQEKVIDVFVSTYLSGRTPNPCVLCNRDIKFDALWEWAETAEAVAIGTGHYARIRTSSEGFALHAGADPAKDQSYFLFTLTQSELARTLFPVGGLAKPQVRALAEALELPVAQKPESQDICFVAGTTYAEFVEKNAPAARRRPGVLRATDGRDLGRHEGVHRFTVGQRRGLGGGAEEPRYVTAIDAESATVTVGGRGDLDRSAFLVQDARWTSAPRPGPARVRLRHRHAPVGCTLHPSGATTRVELDAPAAGVTPGQAAVWYDGDRVLGGGWIADR